MKNFLKFSGIFILVALVFAYIYFLFFLPRQIDLNLYKNDIQKIVKENSNLNLNIGNISLIVTPYLEGGVLLEDINLTLNDGSYVAKIPCARGKISLLNLLLLEVKINKIDIFKPYVNLEIADNKEFKAVKSVEDFLYAKEKNTSLDKIAPKKEGFDLLSLIRINAPSINIYDYRIYVPDNLSKDYLLLTGNKTRLGYFNGKKAGFKTNSTLYLNKQKQVNIALDISAPLPDKNEFDIEDDPAPRAEVPFINPVTTYKNYDFKGDIKGKIKLGKNSINGFLNLDNLTLNLGGYKIPESTIGAEFKGKSIILNTNIFLKNNQNLMVNGKIKSSKTPNFDIDIFSNGVYFNDLILLSKGVLNSLNIKNNLDFIKGEGCFIADAKIKTNSNRWASKGKIEIINGAIVNKMANLGLNKINANLLFNNNTLKIKNTGLNVNEGSIKIQGEINDKADVNVEVISDKLPLPPLFSAFAPGDIKEQINFNKGELSLKANIKGKLKRAKISSTVEIAGLNLSDKLNTVILNNKNFNFDFNKDKLLSGKFQNKGLEISFPYANSTIKDDLLEIIFNDADVELNPTQIRLNKGSALTLRGKIENYAKTPSINFLAEGNIYANELKALLGPVAEPFINAKGLIRLKAALLGDRKKQTLKAQIFADRNNFITPVNIRPILNRQTVSNLLIDFKGNRIKIKDIALYAKMIESEFTNDFTQNLVDSTKVAGVTGTIANLNSKTPVINLLKFETRPFQAEICGFKNSNFNFEGKFALFGNLSSPRTKGKLLVSNFTLPNENIQMKQGKILMNGKEAQISADGVNINGSPMKLNSDLNLAKLPLISLYNLHFLSNYIDADKLIETSNKLSQIVPKSPVNEPVSDIPVEANGNFDIKNLKTGNIKIKNTNGKIFLNKNILTLQNISTEAFRGKITGNINVNLLNYLTNINLQGKNMDANETLRTLANLPDTLTGVLSFKTALSLAGLTYEEQVKSLNGILDFSIKNGQLGPFAKIENIFLSENLRNSEFFKTAIGSHIGSAVSFDTSRYDEIKGSIFFNKTGVATINPIVMQGNSLCVKIGGEMDVLENTLDAHVRGRLASFVASTLGPLANINPVNIVKATPGLNVIMAKTFSLFCEAVSPEEMSLIPAFSKNKSDFNSTKFQITLKGDVNKPVKLFKSFKWLVTEEEYNAAEQFVSNIPNDLPEGVSTIEDLQIYQAELAKQQAESKTLKGKVKNLFKKKNENI